MNIEILGQILENAELGSAGQTIFLHHMPETINEGIMVRMPLAGTPIDHYLPGYLKCRIQVICRATSQAAGDALAAAVSKALTVNNAEYNHPETGEFAMKINYLRPYTLPIVYPRSPGNLKEWSINFDCCYVMAII